MVIGMVVWLLGYLQHVKMQNHQINSWDSGQNVGEHFLKDQTRGFIVWFCSLSRNLLSDLASFFSLFYFPLLWLLLLLNGITACDMGRDVPTEVSTSTSRETCCRSEKLLGLWNSNDQEQGRVLVADMYKMSEADFHVLFPCLNSLGNGSGKAPTDKQFPQSQEFAKVLHLYTVFTQVMVISLAHLIWAVLWF